MTTIHRLDLVDEYGDLARFWGYAGSRRHVREAREHAAEDLHVPVSRIRATAVRVDSTPTAGFELTYAEIAAEKRRGDV